MTNTNCLAGVACPACGQSDRFTIVGSSNFSVTDDGAECVGDIEWDGDSYCSCDECDHNGKLSTFTAPAESEAANGN